MTAVGVVALEQYVVESLPFLPVCEHAVPSTEFQKHTGRESLIRGFMAQYAGAEDLHE